MSVRSIVPFGLKRVQARLRRTLLLTWRSGSRRSLWVCVQSPYLYSFFVEVVHNRSAYYAYDEFVFLWRTFSRQQRRMAKLLFRLANYVQPSMIFVAEGDERWIPFLLRGSRVSEVVVYGERTHVASHNTDACRAYEEMALRAKAEEQDKSKMLIVLPHSDEATIAKARIESYAGQGSIIIATDIRSTPAIKRGWRQLCGMPWASVSIDLYSSGIIMMNSTFSNLHYNTVL